MRTCARPMLALVIAMAVTCGGCARAVRDTGGFATENEATLEAPFDASWQATKAALRAREFDIYTRDKRGVFVAYSKMKRRAFLVPERIQYTVTLEPVSDQATRIAVESIRQVYGVTLLTYPGWHDRKTTDDAEAQALIEAIRAEAATP